MTPLALLRTLITQAQSQGEAGHHLALTTAFNAFDEPAGFTWDELRAITDEVDRLTAALTVCSVVLHRADVISAHAPDPLVHAGQQASSAPETDWTLAEVADDSAGLLRTVQGLLATDGSAS